ncbi:MAG: glycosyl transferase family 2 [Rhodospirillaceae bacterium]|nr:glycosyl transferase family 2 [Rhodospirillaceae bacterium]
MLSVIIPTLDEGERIIPTLDSLKGLVDEIIVSDGGSNDDTVAMSKSFGAKVLLSVRGRGVQLKIGAEEAKGEWLLFLHADTVLSDGWFEETKEFMLKGLQKAAVFQFALDDTRQVARILEKGVSLRNKIFSLPYGDQGLLISQSLYKELGGFKSIPVFEDVDIVRRIGRRRLVFLKSFAKTSAARYKNYRIYYQSFRNLILLLNYFLGVSPKLLARFYK